MWRSIDFDKWNLRDIWGIFERRVRSAAVQNIDLPGFFEALKLKMKVPEVSNVLASEDAERVVAVLTQNDPEVLRQLRENTSLCVLMLRIQQQERKEAYHARTNTSNA